MARIIAVVVLFIFGGFPLSSFGQEIKPDLFKPLKHRHIGPIGNRVSAVAGVPGDPYICYAGAASGGIFKSIGALAVAPSDFNIVWAGTGEAFIRSNISQGNGIYKSTDGGRQSHLKFPKKQVSTASGGICASTKQKRLN